MRKATIFLGQGAISLEKNLFFAMEELWNHRVSVQKNVYENLFRKV